MHTKDGHYEFETYYPCQVYVGNVFVKALQKAQEGITTDVYFGDKLVATFYN